ncbi:hypothetical protein DEU56DRAFT_809213 [Suillus clintonianus]|uniref:uncharacterized protein n=1 Tax=Suillus clintonianus TaxID=1904413 RepID=UPI001B87F745|nr:uncharacterized protein DEU56DRAFT_809213 [Suillus clintonianus]KAG2134465.1 hypothetical protein DEU56DRAFT_809213 [Suillus clintonianus]
MDSSKIIREKFNRVRILIIGRANAGKTTILQRLCNSREKPEVYNRAGKKIDASVLQRSRERGDFDIENGLVFRNYPGFIFHDSRGFEAGGESEYNEVTAFIAGRSKKISLEDRIHVIWYFIPMDRASRCFTEAELKFFRSDYGSIPVMVLFTKFDALYAVEFARLTENGTSKKDAKNLAPKHAPVTFANGSQLKFLYQSKDIRPPKCHVCLPDMNRDDADCRPLMERTAETLHIARPVFSANKLAEISS